MFYFHLRKQTLKNKSFILSALFYTPHDTELKSPSLKGYTMLTEVMRMCTGRGNMPSDDLYDLLVQCTFILGKKKY